MVVQVEAPTYVLEKLVYDLSCLAAPKRQHVSGESLLLSSCEQKRTSKVSKSVVLLAVQLYKGSLSVFVMSHILINSAPMVATWGLNAVIDCRPRRDRTAFKLCADEPR
jgi:hypothetical protein